MATLIISTLFVVVLPLCLVQSQSLDRFIFSEASCIDLKPCSALDLDRNKASDNKNTTSKHLGFVCGPYEDLIDEFPFQESSVWLSTKNSFSPRNLHKVVINSPIEFAGFMIQFTNTKRNETLGQFIDMPQMTKAISCQGNEDGNTAIDSLEPALLRKLNLTWRAPEEAGDTIILRAGFLYQKMYYIIERNLSKMNIPPKNDSDCGKTASCFRLCPSNLKNCSFVDSLLAMKAQIVGNEVVFSLGAALHSHNLYVAVGQASDNHRLKNMRISACYTEDDAGFSVGGYVMFYISSGFLVELQVLKIESHFIDGKMFWCKYRRPIGPKSTNRVDIENSLFLFVYAGQLKDNTNFLIPDRKRLMQTKERIIFRSPINEFIYQNHRNGTEKSHLSPIFPIIIVLSLFSIITMM